MKKMFKFIIGVIILLLIVVGRFYYSVYASEYELEISNDKNIQETTSFILGSYNIKSLNYNHDNLASFNNDIKDLNLDIICLQEVDQDALRSGNCNMLKEMAQANGYKYYQFYSTMWILNGYYGLGVLSKFPIIKISAKLLPNSIFKEPRVLTKATIDLGSKSIDIYNTHLTYEDNSYRIDQMDYVKENINFNNYSILAGDFNSFGMNHNFSINNIKSVNEKKNYLTYQDFAAPDDIFYSDHFKLIESNLKESSFSDHNLLYGKFQLDD